MATKRNDANYITTITGRRLDPLNLKVTDVVIEDIAHALSLLCRYGGHTTTFYSVAEHSILVAFEVLLDTADYTLTLAALLHDASEAYMQDLVSPIKHRIPAYNKAEARTQRTIEKAFNLRITKEGQRTLKEWDVRIREKELLPQNISWRLSSDVAECNFLRLFKYLVKACKTNPPVSDVIGVFMANI